MVSIPQKLQTESFFLDTCLNIFLTTFPCFTTSVVVLQKLVERYFVPPHINESVKELIQTKVCRFIKLWKQIASSEDLNDFLNDINVIEHENGKLVFQTDNLERVIRRAESSAYRPRSQRISVTIFIKQTVLFTYSKIRPMIKLD